MELLDTVLDKGEMVASPDFSNLPAKSPKKTKKFCQQKRKSQLDKTINEITKNFCLDMFGRLPLTPHVLSTLTVLSDEMQKYFEYTFVQSRTLSSLF